MFGTKQEGNQMEALLDDAIRERESLQYTIANRVELKHRFIALTSERLQKELGLRIPCDVNNELMALIFLSTLPMFYTYALNACLDIYVVSSDDVKHYIRALIRIGTQCDLFGTDDIASDDDWMSWFENMN